MIAMLLAATLAPDTVLQSPAMREFRAAWVATVANIDWPTKPGLSNAELRKELTTILDRCEQNNFNAVVFQVRPHGDAMYNSKYEPWSYYLTGQQGKAPEGDWDPLEFVVEEAHDRGIEVHCWFNPYRANHPSQRGSVSSRSLVRQEPSLVKKVGDYMWMDPGEPRVQDWSFNVFMDVVERYDIDGIHIDDYFYPYPSYSGGADFPDGPSWDKYRASGGTLNRGDWRRKNVDDFVERVYKGIKERKPWVKFGISPFGIYRPGEPSGVRTTFDQYAMLYADCLLWLQKGWLDYFTPQLYWKLDSDQPYRTLLDYWMSKNTMKRHLWPGNFSGKLLASDGNWPISELVGQIEYTRKAGAMGNVFFSMKTFTQDFKGINKVLQGGVYKKKALVPASPWLGNARPAQPNCKLNNTNGLLDLAPGTNARGGTFVSNVGGSGVSPEVFERVPRTGPTLSTDPVESNAGHVRADQAILSSSQVPTSAPRFYAVYADFGSGLELVKVTSASRTQISGLSLTKAKTVAVSTVDLVGNESKLQIVKGN